MKLITLTLSISMSLAMIGCAGAEMQPDTAAEIAERGEAAQGEVEPGSEEGLPAYLARLGITEAQRTELDAIGDRLVERVRPADRQRLAFQSAIVGAIEACDSDYARLRIEGRRMIEAGSDAKPVVLDAINELHALLTPEQRRLLVEPMLERSEQRRERSDDEGFAALGKKLDLGIGQVLRMAKRARNRMTLSRSDRDELRDLLDDAGEQFMEPDFDAHRTELAQQPLVEHTVQFIYDLAAVVLPVLEDEQCHVAADFARERLVEDEKKPRSDGSGVRAADPGRSEPRHDVE